MKIHKLILTTVVAIVVMSSGAFALPPGKGGPVITSLKKKKDFEALKPGDKVAIICKVSDSIILIDVKDKKAALEMCKEGAMIYCRCCKKKYKVIWTNPIGKAGGPQPKVTVVNEKGEPCMFFVKIN